jgi:hypothetical protein
MEAATRFWSSMRAGPGRRNESCRAIRAFRSGIPAELGTGAGAWPITRTAVRDSGRSAIATPPPLADVLKAPRDEVPIGLATCVGQDGAGVAIWRLTIHGAELPGGWIVASRKFCPAK